jgi:undecaprenyl-diphosphatase
MSHLSYLEAVVVGVFQGVTELFPVSSLGHSVLIPALIGGSWAQDLNVSTPESPYLAFIVGLHVATAAALLMFFWRDWVAIVTGFATSIVRRRIDEPYQRLAWLIVIATIPVGISGLLLEHLFRTTLGRPMPAAAFLVANGAVLWAGERLRRRSLAPQEERKPTLPALEKVPMTASAAGPATAGTALTMGDIAAAGRFGRGGPAGDGETAEAGAASDRRLADLGMRGAVMIGGAQILALLPGLSRSGSTMVAGLLRGLSHEEAARFSFLLATPVILAAGVLKLPDLFGPLGAGIHGQALAGSLASFVSAYLAVRFLTRWFHTRTLTPFAVYSALLGLGSMAWLTLR